MMIVCPPNWNCVIQCVTISSCQVHGIVCPVSGSCDLQCTGQSSCGLAYFICGTGPCTLACDQTNSIGPYAIESGSSCNYQTSWVNYELSQDTAQYYIAGTNTTTLTVTSTSSTIPGLHVANNAALTLITWSPLISTISNNLVITNNPALTVFSLTPSITAVYGSLIISYNPVLSQLKGFALAHLGSSYTIAYVCGNSPSLFVPLNIASAAAQGYDKCQFQSSGVCPVTYSACS